MNNHVLGTVTFLRDSTAYMNFSLKSGNGKKYLSTKTLIRYYRKCHFSTLKKGELLINTKPRPKTEREMNGVASVNIVYVLACIAT